MSFWEAMPPSNHPLGALPLDPAGDLRFPDPLCPPPNPGCATAINCKKTKETIIGPLSKESLTPLLIAAKPVQRVTEYKLLGVTVNATLKWDDHVNAITSIAAKRLWFLKKL